ncbi:MAG TPA: trehalase family glycosidase [Candidatus Saccharimonadales bacterium]|jgi:alpha,alpha-trehalase|nr:trehalase family glycosidase [Candidatus Saccharimonadales bacterium]
MTTIEAPQSGLFISPLTEFDQLLLEHPELTAADVEPILAHIDVEIPGLICYPEEVTNKLAIPLKHPFMVPSSEATEGFSYKQQQFYWDSYFSATKLLMLYGDKYYDVIIGMLENSVDMFNQYGVIPNSSLYPRLTRSQPPLLTSYIFEVYDTYKDTHEELNQEWLSSKIEVAKQEYNTVWKGVEDPHNRMVFRGLSRYYDIEVTDKPIQAESGWDYSPRFEGRAQDFLPVDLQAFRFKYAMDFAREAGMRGDEREMNEWLDEANYIKDTVNELMYDPEKGVFHDYNYVKGEWGKVDSLASYVTMWAGMVEPHSEQADQMVRALKLFKCAGGLCVTEGLLETDLPEDADELDPLQWKRPNTWSPLTILTADGLEICGYPEEAEDIALHSLAAKIYWFNTHKNEKTGKREILEAYNGVDPTQFPFRGVYPRQRGFGWTDAEIAYFSTKYVHRRHLPAAMMRGAVLMDPQTDPSLN